MSKKVDANSFWYIKHNPISKEGVFPYLGHTISDECEPNKIYKVYRPAKTLADSVETWDNPPKPFLIGHEMVGEGFTPIDERPVQGIIYNPEYKDGVLYADIAVYSEDLKQEIENGKKELSLGYFCKYKKERGVFKGEVYDYVQHDMVGNHIALVDAGRCGSDVKVYDHKCTMDSLDLGAFESPLKKTADSGTIKTEQGKDAEMADKREYIRKIMAIAAKPDSEFDGGESEKIETIAKLLENSEYAKSEDEAEKEEEKKAEDKCGKDEEQEEKKEKKDTEDESEEEEKKTEDSIKELMSIVKDMADDVKKLVAKDEDGDKEEKESEDGDDSEEKSDDDDKKAEDEDDDEEETKKSEDSAVFVFGANSAIAEDEALKDYLK